MDKGFFYSKAILIVLCKNIEKWLKIGDLWGSPDLLRKCLDLSCIPLITEFSDNHREYSTFGGRALRA